uniref:Alkaline phosphatase n=1 Tax=uncultured Elusimicrobia bacterium TaxID=699876 RepID=A0A650EP61_9BACT|nr:alkaline phosphatase [uncultured Elusimicrobia bacterium]
MPARKDYRLAFSLSAIMAALGLFTLARLVLLLLNGAFFETLAAGELFSAFFNGLRFDFSIIILFMGPVIFLLNLPVKKIWYFKLWAGILCIEMLVFLGVLIGDLIYFPKVNRHLSDELVHLVDDWGFVASYAFGQEWPFLVGLLAVAAAAWIGISRLARCYQARSWPWKKELLCSALIIIVTFLGIRGHLGGGKALGVADVYNYVSSPAGAALTLNGVFTSYQVGRRGKMESVNSFPVQQAIETAQRFLFSQDEQAVHPDFPLMRMRQAGQMTAAKQPNILIVMLEGWHPYYVDSLSGNSFGSTPVFDKIVQDGVVFTNAYAAGLRSMYGFAAIFGGLPLVQGLPAFGYGLEQSAISTMPKHFAQAGYYTFFAQTSHRDSYRMCALASSLGAQESYGWEDIPQLLPYNETAPFGYDYDLFMFAADKIKHRTEPNFLGMVFTGITHEPFASTLSRFDRYPYDSWEHGFLNTLSFADWSIGELLNRAREDGWFDDTIFIFVADHTSGGPEDDSLKNRFRIPLVVYAPKLFKPRRIDYVVSQMDIVPTLYRFAGLNPSYTAFGRDLFDGSSARAAIVSEGVNIGLITADGELRHTGKKILSQAGEPGFNQDGSAEMLLLALDKAAYMLLKENRWYQPEVKKELK